MSEVEHEVLNALEELESAVHDGIRRHNAGDPNAINSNAIMATMTQAHRVIDKAKQKNDYNEPFSLAKQRVEIVERMMKLPYIKATRDTERGEERFVSRDDIIEAIHNYAKVKR